MLDTAPLNLAVRRVIVCFFVVVFFPYLIDTFYFCQSFYFRLKLSELGTRYFKSNDDIVTDTLLKKYLRYRYRYIFKKVTISLLGTDFRTFKAKKNFFKSIFVLVFVLQSNEKKALSSFLSHLW